MISRLEVLLLTLSLIAVSVFCQHNTVVYYHNEIKRQVIQNLECEAMNGTTIIVTAATGKQFSLVYRQRHAIKLMDAVEDNECLLRKMITVCLDEECEEKCMEGRILLHSHAYVSPGGLDRETQVMPIDYNSGSHGSKEHNKIVALKWKLIEMAFQYGATTVMYMDADVLLLKNPFIDLLKAHNRTYPLLHLTDTGRGQPGRLYAPPHTGFMLFSIVGMRNTSIGYSNWPRTCSVLITLWIYMRERRREVRLCRGLSRVASEPLRSPEATVYRGMSPCSGRWRKSRRCSDLPR